VEAVTPGASVLVSPVMPNPYGEGRARRAFQWVLELAANSLSVHLVVVGEEAEAAEISDEVRECVQGVVARNAVPGGTRAATVLSLLWPPAALTLRAGIDGWITPPNGATKAIRAGLEGLDIRRIVVFRLFMADVGNLVAQSASGNCSVEVDLDDLESATHASIARLCFRRGRWREMVTRTAGYRQFSFLERRLLPAYRKVYLAAPEDQASLARRTDGLHVDVMPNRIADRPSVRQQLGKIEQPTYLFIGGYGYLPNIDAALWIAERLCPLLRDALKRPFRALIAGRGASPELERRLRAVPEVDYVGQVESVSVLYAQADIALAPLRAGGGTKFKTLEAFQQECPLVASKHAVRGLSARDGIHYLAAGNAKSFAEACRALADDGALRSRIAASAKQLQQEQFALSFEERSLPARDMVGISS
jgi:glycosyltransferase involved in cell wall biosynthesis